MNGSHAVTRRHFLQGLVASASFAASSVLSYRTLADDKNHRHRRFPICCFAKPLQHLSFDALADKMAELGFQGIEATVRKGGQVEPERVADDLPRLVEALRKRGLEVTTMATDVNRVDQPLTESVLRTAGRLGIGRYRLKYYAYDLARPVIDQLRELKPVLAELAALNGECGIMGTYQNHAGAKNVGAPVWDIFALIRDLPREQMSIAFDIRHATVEGSSTWPVEFNLVQSHLGIVYVKDFEWENGKVKNVPLGQGLVSPKFFQLLKASSYTGPVSLHVEYLDHRDPALGPQREKAIANDMQVLRKLLS